MSNKPKKRSNEVAVQLGEPLPLPYTVTSPTNILKKDDDIEKDFKPALRHEPIELRKRLTSQQSGDFSRGDEGSVLQGSSRPGIYTNPRPIAIRRNYLRSLTPIGRNHFEPKQYSVEQKRELIDKIIKDLQSIKDSIDRRQVGLDYELFERFHKELIDILDSIGDTSVADESARRELLESLSADISGNEPTILDELEKFQRRDRFRHGALYASIGVAVVLFLLLSFYLSGLSYEYCYYFC